MLLEGNALLLKRRIEATELLGDRYSNMKLANIDPNTGERRGCFSLVFKALDTHTNKPVAIKFYDPSAQWLQDDYRVAAFRREHQILQTLLGSERCLQLVSPLAVFNLSSDEAIEDAITLPCEYFVVDWLDDEIEEYFLAEDKYSAADKLKLLIDVVLAVEALHSNHVFHRDIKADNLRALLKAAKRIVVAIDLGAAARWDSKALKHSYSPQPGAPGYASPEAICGLAGNRSLARFNDHYAIGCLLFDLFNPDFFYRAVRSVNPSLDLRLGAMRSMVPNNFCEDDQISAWQQALATFSRGVVPPSIDGMGSSVPKGIANLLNELLATLTNIDYRKRSVGTQWARARMASAVRVLENEKQYKKHLEIARERRRRRVDALAAKDARVSAKFPRVEA